MPSSAVLVRAGLPTAGLDRGQASALIDALVRRTAAGRCTVRQARTLARFGYDDDLSFDEASAIIAMLARNQWRRPLRAEAV